MEFRTKWELLEYLGQDKKYVRLIDRMIVKGEVKVDRWWYIYEKPEDEEIKKLREDNEKLKERVHELEEVCKDSLFKDDPVENKDESMYESAYNELYEEHERLKENLVKIYATYCHKYIQWKDFKDKYRLDIYVEWEDE